MPNDDRPLYVTPCDDPVFTPEFYYGRPGRPWRSWALLMPVSPPAIDGLVERFLNEPLGERSPVRYDVVEHLLWLSLNYYAAAGSEEVREVGFFPYVEATLSFPVRRTGPGEDTHLGWFIPTLFLDAPQDARDDAFTHAIAAGRELYGLPKVSGRMEVEPLDPTDSTYVLEHAHLDVLDVPEPGDRLMEYQRIVTIDAVDCSSSARPPADPVEPDLPINLPLIARMLRCDTNAIDVIDENTGSYAGMLIDFRQVFGGRLIGLRQFRDPASHRHAVAQAVVESSFRLAQCYKRPDVMYADHRVRVTDSSFVRLTELGLPEETVVDFADSFFFEARALSGLESETRVWTRA